MSNESSTLSEVVSQFQEEHRDPNQLPQTIERNSKERDDALDQLKEGESHYIPDFYGKHDEYLEAFQKVITDYILAHPELADAPCIITYKVIDPETKEIQIETSTGLILNELLVSGTRVLLGSPHGVIANYETGGDIILTEDSLQMGKLTNIVIAHEFGHALTPYLNDIDIMRSLYAAESSESETTQAMVEAFIQSINALLFAETSANEYGKSVAAVLGISDVEFDEFTSLVNAEFYANSYRELFERLFSYEELIYRDGRFIPNKKFNIPINYLDIIGEKVDILIRIPYFDLQSNTYVRKSIREILEQAKDADPFRSNKRLYNLYNRASV